MENRKIGKIGKRKYGNVNIENRKIDKQRKQEIRNIGKEEH